MTEADAAGTSVADHVARLAAGPSRSRCAWTSTAPCRRSWVDPEAARPLAGAVELRGPLADRYAAVALISGRPAVLAAHQDLRDSVAVRDSGGHLEDKRYAVAQVLT